MLSISFGHLVFDHSSQESKLRIAFLAPLNSVLVDMKAEELKIVLYTQQKRMSISENTDCFYSHNVTIKHFTHSNRGRNTKMICGDEKKKAVIKKNFSFLNVSLINCHQHKSWRDKKKISINLPQPY